MARRMLRATVACLICALLLGGCWDRVEIDQRGFVIGVAIDAPDQSEQSPDGVAGSKYRATFQVVVPSAIKQGQGKSGGGGSEGKGKAYHNVSVQERSLSSLYATLADRSSRIPFMEHLKTIVVSSRVAKAPEGLSAVFDFFLRESDMRRSAHVIIAKEEARKLLDLEVPNEPLPSIYLNEFDRNRRLSSYIPPQVRVGDIQEKLLRYETYTLPEVTLNGKIEASFESVAVIDGKTNRVFGSLKGQDVQSLNFLRGEAKGGIVNFKFEGRVSAFRLDKASSKIVLTNRDPENLAFTIRIFADGTLNETETLDHFSDSEVIAKIEKTVSQTIAGRCEDTTEKLQRKFKKDAIGIGSYMYRNHYRLWQQVKNRWDRGDNEFSRASVKVEVRTKVRRTGNIQQVRKG